MYEKTRSGVETQLRKSPIAQGSCINTVAQNEIRMRSNNLRSSERISCILHYVIKPNEHFNVP